MYSKNIKKIDENTILIKSAYGIAKTASHYLVKAIEKFNFNASTVYF